MECTTLTEGDLRCRRKVSFSSMEDSLRQHDAWLTHPVSHVKSIETYKEESGLQQGDLAA